MTFIEDQLRRWRGLKRLLETDYFAEFYLSLNHEEKITLAEYVVSGDLDGIRKWLKHNSHRTLEGRTIIEIREIASKLGVKYYNTLSKRQLIYKIRRLSKNEFENNATRTFEEVLARHRVEGHGH